MKSTLPLYYSPCVASRCRTTMPTHTFLTDCHACNFHFPTYAKVRFDCQIPERIISSSTMLALVTYAQFPGNPLNTLMLMFGSSRVSCDEFVDASEVFDKSKIETVIHDYDLDMQKATTSSCASSSSFVAFHYLYLLRIMTPRRRR